MTVTLLWGRAERKQNRSPRASDGGFLNAGEEYAGQAYVWTLFLRDNGRAAYCCPPKFNIAIAETKRLIAESTARATAMHDIFAGREHQIPPREKIYTRTLGSAGDLTIYVINPLCESVGGDHGEISSFFETPVSQAVPSMAARVPKSCPELELVGDPRLKIQCAIADGGD
jgi:hypothetical protein